MDHKVKLLMRRLDAAIEDCGDECKRFLLSEDDFKTIKDFLKTIYPPHINIGENLDNISYRGRTICAISKNMEKDIPVDKF